MPSYIGVDETGKEWHSDDLKGKFWILYFYPKDNTSGCTAEACSLRDSVGQFDNLEIPIIGVSKDSATSHKKFKDAHSLPFPLIVDSDTRLQQEMGVWVEKSMYGRKYMGTMRTTFIINGDGIIVYKMEGKEIKTKEHAEQLLAFLEP